MDEEDSKEPATVPQDKLTVYAAVKTACEEIGNNNSLVGTFSVDKDAAILITEIVYRKLEEAGSDIEAFATHARRTNVNVDDVKLLFRKNPKILERIKSIEESEEKDKPSSKRKHAEAELEN